MVPEGYGGLVERLSVNDRRLDRKLLPTACCGLDGGGRTKDLNPGQSTNEMPRTRL